MNFGSNFNDRKLFTRESKSTTRSVDMNRFKDRFGARSVDEVRMSRIKLKDQLNTNIYGPQKMNQVKNDTIVSNHTVNKTTREERQFNHIEAIRNVKRGI